MQWKTEESKARSLANLKPMDWSAEDPETVKEIKRAGRRAQQVSQKRAKDIKNIYAQLLQLDATADVLPESELVKAAQETAEERKQPLSLYEAIALAQAAKAARGDTAAAVFVRDSAGDKPTDKASVEGVITAADEQLIRQMAAKLGMHGNNSAEDEANNG